MRPGILTRRRVQWDAVRDACERAEPVIVVPREPGQHAVSNGVLRSTFADGVEIALGVDGQWPDPQMESVYDVYFRDADGLEYVMATQAHPSVASSIDDRTLRVGRPLRIERARRRVDRTRLSLDEAVAVQLNEIGSKRTTFRGRLLELSDDGMSIELPPTERAMAAAGELFTIRVAHSPEGHEPAVTARCVHVTAREQNWVAGLEFCGGDEPGCVRSALERFQRAVRLVSARKPVNTTPVKEGRPCS